MSSSKSNIVSLLLDAVPPVPPTGSHVPDASLIATRNDASPDGFKWSRFIRKSRDITRGRAYKSLGVIYNVIDGSQILRSAMPSEQTLRTGAKWYYLKNN